MKSLISLPSGVFRHGWEILCKWAFNGKIVELNGDFPASHIWFSGGTCPHLRFLDMRIESVLFYREKSWRYNQPDSGKCRCKLWLGIKKHHLRFQVIFRNFPWCSVIGCRVTIRILFDVANGTPCVVSRPLSRQMHRDGVVAGGQLWHVWQPGNSRFSRWWSVEESVDHHCHP